jgi:beta-glucosidase
MKLVKKTLQEIARLGMIFMAAMLLQASGTAQNAQPTQAEIDQRVETLIGKLTLEEKILLLGGINDFFTRPILRVGIPSLKMSDGPMGVHDYGPTTAYPAGIALAASWDTDLPKRVGISMGKDARARVVHIILAPGMNIYRSPLNGRNFEYFGEDLDERTMREIYLPAFEASVKEAKVGALMDASPKSSLSPGKRNR